MSTVILFIKGLLIGIANIIPGVSGGTFALVLGIFERMMESLKSINTKTIKVGFGLFLKGFSQEAREDFAAEWKRVDATFLVILGVGGLAAILASSWLIDYLLKNYPALTLAFFVGLILPSLWVPYKMMPHRNLSAFFWLIPGAAVTVGLALAFSGVASTELNPFMAFLSGALAISAMILPGVSGSFVLLVMGQYQNVIGAVKTVQRSPDGVTILFLGAFAVGCIAGLFSFARLLNWLLKHFPAGTMAFLIGLILGSFWVLWPFKHYEVSTVKIEKKQIQVATAPNKLPDDFGEFWPCFLSFLVGVIGAGGLTALGKSEMEDHKKTHGEKDKSSPTEKSPPKTKEKGDEESRAEKEDGEKEKDSPSSKSSKEKDS